jgi:hypothetical protein
MRARICWFLTLPALLLAETAGHTLVAGAIDPEDLQLVWGLLAIWLARALLRAAEQLGWALAGRSSHSPRPTRRLSVTPFHAPEPRLPVLASQQAGRAPPAVA